MILARSRNLGQQGKEKTILLVDDEGSIVTAWKRIFQLEGYRVVTASDGHAGLVAANEEKPDLIITDQSMPGMEGVEFCRQLKLEQELAKIPVILASANSPGPGDKVVWDDFWQKPVSVRTMVASIRRLLNAPPI